MIPRTPLRAEPVEDDPRQAVERLFAGPAADLPFGEPVSIGEHMRQAAAIAEADQASRELIVATLLHDVAFVVAGHPEGSTIEPDHAELGAAWLERWFPPAVWRPVRLHVAAKRYLAATEPGYRSSLSAESVRTLELQGGAMTPAEARRFERAEGFGPALRLRRYDELGKDPAVAAPPIEHFGPLITAVGRPGGDIPDEGGTES